MYPDAIVVCGPIHLAEDQVRVPAVVVEVLSRSTEDYDRGANGWPTGISNRCNAMC